MGVLFGTEFAIFSLGSGASFLLVLSFSSKPWVVFSEFENFSVPSSCGVLFPEPVSVGVLLDSELSGADSWLKFLVC
jgi:hypothetical protein